MSNSQVQRIGPAAMLKSYTDPRFKTLKVSVHMLVPMARETAALYGILPGIVTRATREYPDFASLNRRLSELYGASLGVSVRKIGGFQCLTVSVGGIAGSYAFGGEDMFSELTQLLGSVLFRPLKDENGLFPKDHFEQERRQLLELKDAEFNDKITYAHHCCERLLLEGTPAAIDRYGSREDIEQLDLTRLTAAWDELLSSAQFQVFALGNCTPNMDALQEQLSHLGAPQKLGPLPYAEPETVRRREEEQPVSQSKLSLGFRVDAQPEEKLLFQLASAVFGGVPSSKLFRNVREKMGLCYYCSSAFSPLSRAMYVESGVETENLERAETEILSQLSALQQGDLTEDELLSAKLALCNSFRSVNDSLNAVENWYLSQMFAGLQLTPEEAAARVMEFSSGQVVEAARKMKLAAVYSLKGREEG